MSTATNSGPAPVMRSIRPRHYRHDFSTVPRHWLGDSAVATALVNGVNLVFPLGEKFFIRSVRHYEHRYTPGSDRHKEIRGFYGQEGRHAHEHERFFARMEEHGFHIQRFLKRYERVAYGRIERLTSPELRLATTAALEHYTAILAEVAFHGPELERAHPVMRQFLRWHAAEEIEHKAVAFDVLRDVNPSYELRLRGLLMATAMLTLWWAVATKDLWQQEGISVLDGVRELRRLRAQMQEETGQSYHVVRDVFWRGIRDYVRRDFHPDDHDNYHLAAAYFEEREDTPAAA